jgi:hypothetical protein
MKSLLLKLAFSTFSAWLCTCGARGEDVTFFFAGRVSWIYNPYGAGDALAVSVGDPVQLSLRFDTNTRDLYPEDPTRGAFEGPGWLKTSINGLAFEQTQTVQIGVIHSGNGGQEFFQALALGAASTWPGPLVAYPQKRTVIAFWETGPPYDLLSNAELPTQMDISRADNSFASVLTAGEVETVYEIGFSLVQVPEPCSTALFAVGLLLWRVRQQHFGRCAHPRKRPCGT